MVRLLVYNLRLKSLNYLLKIIYNEGFAISVKFVYEGVGNYTNFVSKGNIHFKNQLYMIVQLTWVAAVQLQ